MNTEKIPTSSSKKSKANNMNIPRNSQTSQAVNSKVLIANKSSLRHPCINPVSSHKKFNSTNKIPNTLDFPIPFNQEIVNPITTHDFANITSKNFNRHKTNQLASSKQVKQKSISRSPFKNNKNEKSFQTTTEDKTPRSLYNPSNSGNVSGTLIKFNNSPNNRVHRVQGKRATDKSENKSDISSISNNYTNVKTENLNVKTLLDRKKMYNGKKFSDNQVDRFIPKQSKKTSKSSYQRIANSSSIIPNSISAATNSSVSDNSNVNPSLLNKFGIVDDRKFSIIDIPYSSQIVEEIKLTNKSFIPASCFNSTQLNAMKTPQLKSLYILVANK